MAERQKVKILIFMNALESLNPEKFGKISKEIMRSTRGGTQTAGGTYTLNGVDKKCASDCTSMAGGRYYAEWYDSAGKVIDTFWG